VWRVPARGVRHRLQGRGGAHEHGEAHRLRGLGLFEGTTVRVLDSRNGMLLEVKGARLALGQALARAITVLPIGG
jgi:Fe2+ transport system protein FeoA